MAQGLHDGVGHGLAVIALHAQVALHVLERSPVPAEDAERLRRSLDAIRASSQESLTALRRELAAINSGTASRAPAPGPAELGPLLERVRSGGLVVEVPSGLPSGIPEEPGQVVYAVVQESLTNVLRHARARRATVSFRSSGGHLTDCRGRRRGPCGLLAVLRYGPDRTALPGSADRRAARNPACHGWIHGAYDDPGRSCGGTVIRVALIDDQPLVRMGLATLIATEPDLEHAGEAGNGREGLALIRRTRPDVALCDIRMPVLDGLGLLAAVTADPALRGYGW
nr:response regulator [Kineosporia corallincola]